MRLWNRTYDFRTKGGPEKSTQGAEGGPNYRESSLGDLVGLGGAPQPIEGPSCQCFNKAGLVQVHRGSVVNVQTSMIRGGPASCLRAFLLQVPRKWEPIPSG